MTDKQFNELRKQIVEKFNSVFYMMLFVMFLFVAIAIIFAIGIDKILNALP